MGLGCLRSSCFSVLFLSLAAIADDFPLRDFSEEATRAFLPVPQSLDEHGIDRMPREFAALTSKYIDRLKQEKLSAYTEDEVARFFERLSMVIFYTHDARLFSVQERLARYAREAGYKLQLDKPLFESALRVGDFESARSIWRQNESVSEIEPPTILYADAFDPRYRFALSADLARGGWLAHNVGWEQGAKVFVLTWAECQFTKRAVEAISADPELESFFSGSATWLLEPGANDDFSFLSGKQKGVQLGRWAKIQYMRDWPEFPQKLSPTFVFVKDGKLIQRIDGWEGEKTLKDLRSLINALAE